MNLKVLLPYKIFLEKSGVSNIVVETSVGSMGILPHRLDCIAPLTAGILIYKDEADGECYIAVDAGVLVKTGLDVIISVRNAISGMDLGELQKAVELDFLNLNEEEKKFSSVMERMESNFIRRFTEFNHE